MKLEMRSVKNIAAAAIDSGCGLWLRISQARDRKCCTG